MDIYIAIFYSIGALGKYFLLMSLLTIAVDFLIRETHYITTFEFLRLL